MCFLDKFGIIVGYLFLLVYRQGRLIELKVAVLDVVQHVGFGIVSACAILFV